MKRRFLTVIAMLAILLQGLSTAWAVMPLAQATAPVQRMAMTADAEEGVPCPMHHAAAAQASAPMHAGCNHGAQCKCPQFCALAAAAALPAQAPAIVPSNGAQILARAPLPQISGAHTLHPLRPPITRSS